MCLWLLFLLCNPFGLTDCTTVVVHISLVHGEYVLWEDFLGT